MSWVSRFYRRTGWVNLRWLDGTFRVALGGACHFGTGAKHWHVSSHGRCRDSRGRLTLGILDPTGYRKVNIFGNDFFVHRVVAFAFWGLPEKGSAWQVHHIDGDKCNNGADNLTYVTHSENC